MTDDERKQIERVTEGLAVAVREPMTRMSEALSEVTEAMLRPLRAASFKMTTAMREVTEPLGRALRPKTAGAEAHRNGTDTLSHEDPASEDREPDLRVVLVRCGCCPDRPKVMLAVHPRYGVVVRRNKGRGQRHEVFLSADELLPLMAGTADKEEIKAWVANILRFRTTRLFLFGKLWPEGHFSPEQHT